MRILGIDPGYERLGVAIIEKNTVVYSDCFRTSPKDDIHKRLGEIGAEISRIMDKFKPDALALETLFITKNQKTGMRVAEARGIIMYEAIKRGLPVHEYSPMQIKTAITSDGSSDKQRMMKMVNLLVKIPTQKASGDASAMLDDEYDAIAVALTHAAIAR